MKKSVRIKEKDEDEGGLLQDASPMPVRQELDGHHLVDMTPSSEQGGDDYFWRSSASQVDPSWDNNMEAHLDEKAPEPAVTEERIEEDDDEDFDWDADPDQPKRRPTTRQRITAAIRRRRRYCCCWAYLSPFMKRLIIAVLGSGVFITIAICFYAYFPRPSDEEKAQPGFKNVRSNVQCWMYWAAALWHIFWLTTMVVELVPSVVSLWTKIFKGRRSERVKSHMEYYMTLRRYIGLVIVSAFNWGCWAFLTDYPFDSVKDQGYSGYVFKAFACVFVACCFLLVQKTIIQIIATRFNRFAFDTRLRENRYALKILDALSQSEVKHHEPTMSSSGLLRNRRSNNNLQQEYNTTPPSSRGSTPRNTGDKQLFGQLQKKLHDIVLTDQPQARSRINRDKVDINSNEFAKKVARKLFYSLAGPDEKYLEKEQFFRYFAKREEAEAAFNVFDKDGNGNLSRREFRDTVIQIYRERKALAQSMRDTSQALGKIDAMLLIVSTLATVFISLAVFHVDVWQSLVPLGSCLVALTFVFGNTCKNTFDSTLFLFVTHPYDAGDYVIIDDQFLLVHNLGIMGTVFIRGDGQQVYAPTTVLMTKLITNVRRSGSMGESIVFNIDFRTSTEKLHELQDRVRAWVDSKTRDFAPGSDLRVTDIVDVNQIILTAWLPHKGNWQDLGLRFQRRTMFMVALKDILTELDIRYELPAQKFTQAREDPASSFLRETPQSFAQGSRA